MADYSTASGLVVVERPHRRAVPRDNEPNANLAGVNDPPSTVGPTSSEGFGNTNVMYPAGMPPLEAQAWSGWPVGWETPNYNSSAAPSWFQSRVSVVMMSVDFLSRNMATMPLIVSRMSQPVSPQPSWVYNPEPKAYAHRGDFLRQAINTLLLCGEAIIGATARDSTGYPSRFVALNPSLVNVEMVGGVVEYSIGGRPIDPADLCHVRYQSWPGNPRGIGPLEWVARNLYGAEALERYQAQITTRGAVPWGVLTAPGNLNAKQAGDAREAFMAARANGNGAPAVLSGGMTLQALSLSPRDLGLLELRELDESRIVSAFGLFPFLLGLRQEAGSLVYQNVGQLYSGVWRQTMRPLAVNLMMALSAWCLPRGTDVYLDSDEFVRPEWADRIAAFAQLHGIAESADDPMQRAITVEEIRALLNLANEDATGLAATSSAVG